MKQSLGQAALKDRSSPGDVHHAGASDRLSSNIRKIKAYSRTVNTKVIATPLLGHVSSRVESNE